MVGFVDESNQSISKYLDVNLECVPGNRGYKVISLGC